MGTFAAGIASALEVYARQTRNVETESKACEIRLRAERRCGRMLADREMARPGPTPAVRSQRATDPPEAFARAPPSPAAKEDNRVKGGVLNLSPQRRPAGDTASDARRHGLRADPRADAPLTQMPPLPTADALRAIKRACLGVSNAPWAAPQPDARFGHGSRWSARPSRRMVVHHVNRSGVGSG